MNRVEILAPAGDYDCFTAAINAGADAVYLGGNFSARAYAKNFTDEEVLSAISYAHFYGRKVYMTLNIVMKQEELESIKSYLTPFYLCGLDGVIVQDIGLISYISKVFPDLPIHASTQMTLTDSHSVKLLEELGISRVVLARELSLSEIKKIHEECNSELECFIHGALCYSYSGKCLMSSFLGGRSGNRGRCAGTCRLPFDDEYLLSCKDICTLKIIPDLIKAGISSFKIEGRMKSPEYVAGVVGIYRKYVDLYFSSPETFKVDKKDYQMLLELYTRSGNCEGYYFKKNGRDMITVSAPGYAKADDTLLKETYDKFTEKDYKKSVDFTFVMKRNMPVCIKATSGTLEISYSSDVPGEAINRPISKDDILKQLNKVGGTGYKIGAVDINLDDGLFMPVGKINEIRRNALDLLSDEILKEFKRDASSIGEYFDESKLDKTENDFNKTNLHVYVRTALQAYEAYITKKADIISVDFLSLINDDSFLKTVHDNYNEYSPKIFIVLPSIVRFDFIERYDDKIKTLLDDSVISGVVVDDYEFLNYLKSINYSGEVLCDLHMYALNNSAIEKFKALGASRLTTPLELNKAELLRRGASYEDLIVYGHVPLMLSAQCIQNTKFGCNKADSANYLKDRYNKKFIAVSNCSECTSTIFNCVPISLHKDLELINRLKPYSVRLMFTTESEDEISDIIEGFYGLIKDGQNYEADYEYTRGHLGRGVE